MDILLIDDHPLFRKALRRTLWDLFDPLCVEETEGVRQALDLLATPYRPDLVLYDWRLPDGGGLNGLMAITLCLPSIPVVVISANEDPDIIASALAAGARGYIPKSSTSGVIRSALQLVMEGETYVPSAALDGPGQAVIIPPAQEELLTAREKDVLHHMAEGFSNKRIALELGIAEATVRVHVSHILDKLQVKNRTQAVTKARRLGLLDAAINEED